MVSSLATAPDLRKLVRQIRSAHKHPFRLRLLLEEYELVYGTTANSAVLEIVAEDTQKIWAGIARDRGSNSLDDLLDVLWHQFSEVGARIIVQNGCNSIRVHVSECPIADIYRNIGKETFGELFHCSAAVHIVKGFNDSINIIVTSCLMHGDDCCHHEYNRKA